MAALPARALPRYLWTDAAIDRALALGLAAGTLALNLFKLPGTSLWSDEAFSIGLVGTPWPVFWDYIRTQEANMVLYHLLLRAWLGLTALVGLVPDELVVRAPSVVFGAIAAVVVFALGLRFWGRTVGAIGAVLFSLNELELFGAREARSYSLEVLLICVGWYALFAALTAKRRRRWWLVYGLAMTLALYAHLFSALVLAAQLVAFAGALVARNEWRNEARHSLREMALTVGAICGALSPMVVYAVRHGGTNAWIQPASPRGIAQLLWNIAGHDVVFGFLLGGAVATAAVFTIRGWKRQVPPRQSPRMGRNIALWCWLLVPVILSYAATQPGFNLHLFSWGYLVVVVPALCLLAGIGLAALPWRLARHVAMVCLIAAAAVATPVLSSSQPTQDFRTAARWIADHYQTGDGLISASGSSPATDYYARIGVMPSALVAGAPSSWSWTEGGERVLAESAVAAYAATHGRVFLVSSVRQDDRIDSVQQVRMTESQFDRRYVLLADVVVPSQLGGIRVRLYETGGAPN